MSKAPKTGSSMPSNGPPEAKPEATAGPAAASPTPPAPATARPPETPPGDDVARAAAEAAAQDLADQRARLKSLSARLSKAVKLRDSIRARARKLEEDQLEYRRFVEDRNRELVQEARDFRSAEADAQAEMGEIPDLEAAIARIRNDIGEG